MAVNYSEENEWGIQIFPEEGTLRIYHIDEHGLADKDIEATLEILPELYKWLEERANLESRSHQG